MSADIKGSSLRRLILGTQVIKLAQAFPQTATSTLFTVSSGKVLVTSLIGVVSTVVAGTDPQLSLGTAPTVGTAETSGIATTKALTSAEVGTLITVGHVSGLPTPLIVMTTAAKAGNTVFMENPGFVVSAGTITQTTQASETGAINWYLTYIPIDTGAYVS